MKVIVVRVLEQEVNDESGPWLVEDVKVDKAMQAIESLVRDHMFSSGSLVERKWYFRRERALRTFTHVEFRNLEKKGKAAIARRSHTVMVPVQDFMDMLEVVRTSQQKKPDAFPTKEQAEAASGIDLPDDVPKEEEL